MKSISVKFGVDIRVYGVGSPLRPSFEYDFRSLLHHFQEAAEKETYRVQLFCRKGPYSWRYKLAKHDYDIIYYKNMDDLRKLAWLHNCRVIFTDEFEALSVLRLLCRKYYPKAMDDFYQELKHDKERVKLYAG